MNKPIKDSAKTQAQKVQPAKAEKASPMSAMKSQPSGKPSGSADVSSKDKAKRK